MVLVVTARGEPPWGEDVGVASPPRVTGFPAG
jgi:hypothetical protein